VARNLANPSSVIWPVSTIQRPLLAARSIVGSIVEIKIPEKRKRR
jgi:hypothetical protein